MYARGVTGSNDMPYHTLWTENWGVPLCKKQLQETVSEKFYAFFALIQSRIVLKD